MVKKKMQCPSCDRCIGYFISSEESITNILKDKPLTIDNKTGIYNKICPRCKKELFIIMSFKN